ncbi:MAG: molybdopterin-dependent oxidoreductase [Acidobacteriota bacterium]
MAYSQNLHSPLGHRLIRRKENPLNAEPPLEELVKSWITPLELFFIRNHAPTPEVEPGDYRLRIEGLVEQSLELSLEDLRSRFPMLDVTATLQCAGNRRRQHSRTSQVEGVPWDAGALGNAGWRGLQLSALLKLAGVRAQARHVWFTGLDEPRQGEDVHFGGSIPLAKAYSPETLIALEMNGEPLTREHGYPARALVPGFIAARSVKWLSTITLSDVPSNNHFQTESYKIAPPEHTGRNIDWLRLPALNETPINCAISSPGAGQKVSADMVCVRGYATAQGADAHTISRVQASPDNGDTWVEGQISWPQEPFAWVLWEARLQLMPGQHMLVARAWDSSGALQPESVPWNFKGYLYNGWHHLPICVTG